MNEELEKKFLEEMKPLIDDYERYVDEEMPYSSVIEVNKYKQYANDEEGKILQSLDEELEKLVASKMAELTQAREKKTQQKREEIYTKTQEFVDATRGKIDEHIKEKNEQMQKKQEEAKTYTKEIVDIKRKLATIQQGITMFKDIDEHIYTAMNESEQEKMNDLTEKNRLYNQIEKDYNGMKDEVRQLEEELSRFEKTYGRIDFESENVIDDILKIIKEQQEKYLSNKSKDEVNNPRTHETSDDDIKMTSIGELEKRRRAKEEKDSSVLDNDEGTQKEEEAEQNEDQKERTVFPRINPDDVEVIAPPKVLTRDDLKGNEGQDSSVLDNDENEVDEEKRKQEEEQMWEEYRKEQEEQEEQAKKEIKEKLEEHEQKIAKAREKNDEAEAKFYKKLEKEKQEFKEEQEKEKEIREKKEEFFNKKEKGYEDLLKDDVSYQALKEKLINTYKLPQLEKALNKKSLVEIYELYVKQVIKDLENAEIIEEGLTEEELEAKLQEKLDNEELKTILSVRLEILKDREKQIKKQEQEQEKYNQREEQVTKFFEKIEEKYGTDLLPIVYLKDKQELIEKYAKGESTELLSNFKFLEYCEEQLKSLEEFLNDPIIKEEVEAGATLEEVDAYNDLQYKIEDIRKKALDLGEISPFMQECKEKLEKFLAKSEEGYKDLLPTLYYDIKENNIKNQMLSFMRNSTNINQILAEYEEKYDRASVDKILNFCKIVERNITDGKDYVKKNGEVATDAEIYELRNAIQQIEKRKYIKENAYKETKIVVEPYNDRIMVYLKGEVEPRERKDLAQLMKDGKNLYKSGSSNKGRNLKGSVKGIEKGNYAIIAVLSELGIEKKEDYIEGYSWMFEKNPNATSKIDSIVYDFSNENGKIQSQKMIKEMKKYAKDAEKYGVAESIERKKGIREKAKDRITGFFGKGKEKVLAIGEGIKGFHPIENAIENRRAKKYSKDREVDGAKATSTYNEWEYNQNNAYNDLIARIRQNVPTEEEQAEYIEKLKNEQVFKDTGDREKKSEMGYNRREDEFYDMYGG